MGQMDVLKIKGDDDDDDVVAADINHRQIKTNLIHQLSV